MDEARSIVNMVREYDQLRDLEIYIDSHKHYRTWTLSAQGSPVGDAEVPFELRRRFEQTLLDYISELENVIHRIELPNNENQ